MNILYIHQYFVTPRQPGGTRSYWIAKRLMAEGHHVTLLTASSKIVKKVERVEVDGISVIYVRVPYNQRMGVLRRLFSFVRFMLLSTYLAWKQSSIDLVISTSTPLTVGFPALMLKWFKKTPYIFEVRDLWPEVPIQMGVLNNPIIRGAAKWFEKTIYRNATHVITLSPGMREGVVKYIDKAKTSMIPNMAKIDEFWPRAKSTQIMQELGLSPDTFKVIHFGSLGVANGAEYIVDAAAILRNQTDIQIIFIGGGSTEEDLRRKTERLKLTNVKFLGAFPMKQTSEIVNFCDVSIVCFKDISILNTNSPNKLFDSLSAGKPIIVNSCGWTKDLVESEDCGFYVSPKDPTELANRIVFLRDNPDVLKEMGGKSRKLAETRYDKSILCKEFVDVVQSKMEWR